MIGAIIGDTVGSRFEFKNYRNKDFKLFVEDCDLTDDSIMTFAVMEIMQRRIYNDKDAIIDTFKKWGRAYPYRGYGGGFSSWLDSDSRDAYNSYGNGAAMRISPVGYYANSEEEVKEAARAITEVTHNHPEGLKGAEVTAMCIYYAKIGKSKEFIKDYASRYYNLEFDYDELRRTYKFNETCQDTVPQAIYAFLISTDFEDAIRTAISIGGDSDTLACITGGISEAFYKHIPGDIIDEFLQFIPEDVDGCSPGDVFAEYLADRLVTLTSSEEIYAETNILADVQGDEDGNAMSFEYSDKRDVLIDFIIDAYLDYDEVTQEDIKSIEDVRYKSIEEINEVTNKIRYDHDLIQGFVLFSNPNDALKAIGENCTKTTPSFYGHIFDNIYMNFPE